MTKEGRLQSQQISMDVKESFKRKTIEIAHNPGEKFKRELRKSVNKALFSAKSANGGPRWRMRAQNALLLGKTCTNPRPGHYFTHAHSHITRAVAAMDSCFALTGAHKHGVAVGQWPGKTRVEKILSCRGESFKCHLHTTHVGAVGWEPHSCSPTTCAGTAYHGLVYVCP